MKSLEKLQQSYQVQKEIFDQAEKKRLQNVAEERERVLRKIANLQVQVDELNKRLDNPRVFQSFEKFREQCLQQSSKQQKES